MKTAKMFITTMLVVFVSTVLFAQSGTKSESIKVSGNCDMCKARIEKAAKIDGVTKAEWNKETQMLAVVYNPSKVKNEDIQKKIAAAGHDTEKFKADAQAYTKLPSCCKYEQKK